MSVVETEGALGEWNITLKADTPREILDKLKFFGRIAISAGVDDPRVAGDSLLISARYVGVLRNRQFTKGPKTLSGCGMLYWLGDEDGKGHTIETPITITNQSFVSTITTLLPSSLTAGTITALAGLHNNVYQYMSRRDAIKYVAALYGAEYRVTGDAKLDAGTPTDLYGSIPTCAVIRGEVGMDMDLRALPGEADLVADVEDFTTRVLLLAEGEGTQIVTAAVDIAGGLNPYKDPQGNAVKLTRIISESGTQEGNATARAQLQLNRFTSPRDALKLDTTTHDIKGDLVVGGYIWVHDADALLVDLNQEIIFKGLRLNPIKLRLFQAAWPVKKGMGVAFRTDIGEWIDLHQYVEYEDGTTGLVVGGYNRSLTSSSNGTEPIGTRPAFDDTVPSTPTFVTPFVQSVYQNAAGQSKAQMTVKWTLPTNSNGTVIADGAYYDIRYRSTVSPAGTYTFIQVPWGNIETLVLELTNAITYGFEIRAVDNATPGNASAWSSVTNVLTPRDLIAPGDPAPGEVAGSLIAVQVTHRLGLAAGGSYNLPADMDHLQIHGGATAGFVVDVPGLPGDISTTMIGKLLVNASMITSQVAAVGTFPVSETTARWYKMVAVDKDGNVSGASTAVQVTAALIDNAHISDLTVTKITAGTISAAWIIGADVATALSGTRSGMNAAGFYAFDAAGVKTFEVLAASGNVTIIGTVLTGPITGDRIRLQDEGFPTIRFFSIAAPSSSAFINSFVEGVEQGLGLNSSAQSNGDMRSILYMRYLSMTQVIVAGPGHPTLPDQTRIGGSSITDSNSINLRVFNTSGSIATDGGSLLLQRGGSTSSFNYTNTANTVNHAMSMNATLVRINYDSAGTDRGIDLDNNGVGIYVDGGYRFNIRAGHVEAAHYRGFSATAFRGEISGGAAGDYFGIRNSPPNADPVLDVIGFTARFVKNFVIDHPTNEDRWLVHACTETPSAKVEYTGTIEIMDYEAEIILPPYFEDLVQLDDRQVFLQVMLPNEGFHPYIPRAIPSFPKNGKFRISSDGMNGTVVSWKVVGVRKDVPQFEVEPLKADYDRGGELPYTYLMKK